MIRVQSEPPIEPSESVTPAAGTVLGDWSAIDPISILLVGVVGGVLLLFGARILRPALVLAATTLGAVLGLQMAGATRAGTLPSLLAVLAIPPLAWIIGFPLLFGLVGIVGARLAMAVLFGTAAGTAVLLVGLSMAADRGNVASPGDITSASFVTIVPIDDDAGDSGDPSGRLLDAAVDGVMDRLEQDLQDGKGLDRLAGLVPDGLAGWWGSAVTGVPDGTVDLVVALAVVVGLCGALLTILIPDRSAIVATSVTGGWMLVGSIVAAWARWLPAVETPTPFLAVLAWGVLTSLGCGWQVRVARRARRAAESS